MLPVNPIGVFNDWCDGMKPITNRDIALITSLTQLSIAERVSVLMLKINRKWITEIRIGSEPYDSKINDISGTLDELGLSYGMNWYIHSKKGRLEWIQVASSPNLLRYIERDTPLNKSGRFPADYIQERKSLTSLEAGILYGYPITAVLAFTKIYGKPKYARKTTSAQYYQAGVYSETHYMEEQRYYESVWKLLQKTAPELIALAEADFKCLKQ
ncbi:MAG: hypothetical protein AAB669_04135 [Patescibacteria group bacterium]